MVAVGSGGRGSAAAPRALGAVEAFRRVPLHRGGDVDANLLYAFEGAIRDVRWDRLPVEERRRLRREAGIG